MPTPHGTRGGLAFSADEVRVVRRALAEALHPSGTARVAAPRTGARHAVPAGPALSAVVAPRAAAYVQDCLRLALAVDDALEEADRLHAFLLAELRRYRDALPGGAAGYLERLRTALADGYVPGAADLAALRTLCALPCGTSEHRRRTELLRRCEILAENDVRLRLEAHMPAPRRLLPLRGPVLAEPPAEEPAQEPDRPNEPNKPDETDKPGRPAKEPGEPERTDQPDRTPPAEPEEPRPQPEPRPRPRPQPKPKPAPGRRTPTPAEIWPPHRRPHRPPQSRSA
jgi:hypothetical protein